MKIKFNPALFRQLINTQSRDEQVVFLLGKIDGDTISICSVLPTPNTWRGDKTAHYTFRAAAANQARAKAAEMGMDMIGHAHTHPAISDPRGPSESDVAFIRPGEIGAVIHPVSHAITWYMQSGTIQVDQRLLTATAKATRATTARARRGSAATGTTGQIGTSATAPATRSTKQ